MTRETNSARVYYTYDTRATQTARAYVYTHMYIIYIHTTRETNSARVYYTYDTRATQTPRAYIYIYTKKPEAKTKSSFVVRNLSWGLPVTTRQ